MKDHRLIDERSLAFDRLVAQKLRADPTIIDQARHNLERWLLTCSHHVRPALLEWQHILDEPLEQVFTILEATDERATRLRQSSPFAGVFTAAERTKILLDFQARESLPA